MDLDIEIQIKTVMTGQPLNASNGAELIAINDLVLFQPLVGGTPQQNYQMTPDQALAVGRALIVAAGNLLAKEIGDDGQRISVTERLARLQKGLS